jgi:hypothetical protein
MCGKQYITSQNNDFACSFENEPDSRASKGGRRLLIEDIVDVILTFHLWYNYPVVSHHLLVIWEEEAISLVDNIFDTRFHIIPKDRETEQL